MYSQVSPQNPWFLNWFADVQIWGCSNERFGRGHIEVGELLLEWSFPKTCKSCQNVLSFLVYIYGLGSTYSPTASVKNFYYKLLSTIFSHMLCLKFKPASKSSKFSPMQVHIIVDNADIENLNYVNLRAATSAALLLLPSKFTEVSFFENFSHFKMTIILFTSWCLYRKIVDVYTGRSICQIM